MAAIALEIAAAFDVAGDADGADPRLACGFIASERGRRREQTSQRRCEEKSGT